MARTIVAIILDALLLLFNIFKPMTVMRGIIIALASIGLILGIVYIVLRKSK